MRLLIDSSAWGGMVADLSEAGHDVVRVEDIWPEDPGDEAILDYAFREGRVIITRDKDFGELAVLQGRSHSGIIRLWDTPARQQAAVVLAVVQAHEQSVLAGAIITASPYRLRIRTP